jgi:diacylglycerol O-acyltransferase / wax synthase
VRQMLGADEYHLYVEAPYQTQHTLKSMLVDPRGAHEPLTYDRMREWARRALPHIEPLRWQLAGRPIGLGHRFLLDRPNLDLDYHVHRASAAEPGGRAELSDVLGRIMHGSLDRTRPLWQLWFVDGLADGHVALVWKLHHALADGGACVDLFEAAFQHTADERVQFPETNPPTDPAPDRRELVRVGWQTIPPRVKRFPGLVYRSLRAARVGARRRKQGLPGPARPFEAPETRLNRPFTPNRLCVWTSLAFDDITAVRKAFDCTVNDVYVAVCAGAIRAYLQRQGELPDKSLTTNIPVSIRQEHEQGSFGNRLSTWFISLATDVPDPAERLAAVTSNTRAARAYYEARASERLLFEWQDYDWLFKPVVFMGHVSTRFAKRPAYNTIVSNVRGPAPLWFDGAEVLEIQSMGQLASGLGLNLTGWTYRGRMNVGVVACPEHAPDLWALADGLPAALAELREAARAQPSLASA